MARMQPITETDFRRYSPLHRPSWRWDWAVELACRDFLPRRIDPLVHDAARFLRRYPTDDDVPRRLCEHRSNVLAARQIHIAGGAVRDEIEARLLTGQPNDVIAARLGVSAGIVTTYGALFFDVAESLAATDWTTYSAIGLGRIRPAAVSEGDIWRFTAFFGGEHPLDLIIADHRGRTEPAVADRHLLAEQGRWVAREGFWVAATWRVDRVHLDEGRRLFAGVVKRDPMLATQVGFLRRVVCAPQRDQSLTATKAAHSKSKGSRAKPRRPSAPSETAAKPPARSEPHDQTDALKPREVGPIEGPAYGKADPEECRPAA